VSGWLRVSRRTVLGWIAGLGLASLLGRLGLSALIDARRRRTDGEDIASLFRERESAIALGRVYLGLRPEEASRAALLSRLGLSEPDLGGLTTEPSRTEVRTRLLQRHRDDFRLSRVVAVEGWVLSETELRLCALAWFLAAPQG
jgi:hypothetical protein